VLFRSTTIVPARPGQPRDKAKVEVAVQIAQRWILARLRHQRFFSLAALNDRIAELRDALNAREMRTYGASRRALFDRVERATLAPLPATRFTYADWLTTRVRHDYHVAFDHHFYSVPFALVDTTVEVRATTTTLEVFARGRRVAAHARSFVRGAATTVPDHRPIAHQQHAAWTPARLGTWAATIGPATAALVAAILAERRHPEHGYRSCLGLLRLTTTYGAARVEAACGRGLVLGVRSYRSLASMLRHGLDREPLPGDRAPAATGPTHENVRGARYYH
jgi:transposase